MDLIIVESPSKAKTISKYLKGKYRVDASGGPTVCVASVGYLTGPAVTCGTLPFMAAVARGAAAERSNKIERQ